MTQVEERGDQKGPLLTVTQQLGFLLQTYSRAHTQLPLNQLSPHWQNYFGTHKGTLVKDKRLFD